MNNPFDGVWHKSSHSTGTSCVEVAETPTVIGVRDTKDRDGGTLHIDPKAWTDFISAIKRNEF